MLSAFVQKTTGVNPWMNAQRCTTARCRHNLLKADLADAKRRRVFRHHGCKAVVLHVHCVPCLPSGRQKGEEAKAWLIDRATSALQAAGKIHSDIERGFIRAEVVKYNDFVDARSSLVEVKKKGLLRLESKEYIVKDGDIIDFRFAV